MLLGLPGSTLASKGALGSSLGYLFIAEELGGQNLLESPMCGGEIVILNREKVHGCDWNPDFISS